MCARDGSGAGTYRPAVSSCGSRTLECFRFGASEARAARSGGGPGRGKVAQQICREALGAGGERARFLSRPPARRVQIENLHLPAVAGPRRVVGERACTSSRAEQEQRGGYSPAHPKYGATKYTGASTAWLCTRRQALLHRGGGTHSVYRPLAISGCRAAWCDALHRAARGSRTSAAG